MNVLPPKNFVCQVCKQEFKNQRALHSHIKAHDLFLAEYYTTYYPRVDLYTGAKIPFKNKNDYFLKDFVNRENLEKWIEEEDEFEVKAYMVQLIRRRLKMKEQKYAPCSLELDTLDMPSVDCFKKKFGSYGTACKEAGTSPLFPNPLPKGFFSFNSYLEDIPILIDTREQLPLSFKNSQKKKLDFGDYTTSGEDYDYTYIDRKSVDDFKSTFTINEKRFRDELRRAKQFNSFIFVVVDGTREDLEHGHKTNMVYLWHNVRSILHDFAGTIQIIFSGNRTNSTRLIPKILSYGKKIWKTDLEYFIRKKIINGVDRG
jgi:hypothetical protein